MVGLLLVVLCFLGMCCILFGLAFLADLAAGVTSAGVEVETAPGTAEGTVDGVGSAAETIPVKERTVNAATNVDRTFFNVILLGHVFETLTEKAVPFRIRLSLLYMKPITWQQEQRQQGQQHQRQASLLSWFFSF
jgi:hypothetical protein